MSVSLGALLALLAWPHVVLSCAEWRRTCVHAPATPGFSLDPGAGPGYKLVIASFDPGLSLHSLDLPGMGCLCAPPVGEGGEAHAGDRHWPRSQLVWLRGTPGGQGPLIIWWQRRRRMPQHVRAAHAR